MNNQGNFTEPYGLAKYPSNLMKLLIPTRLKRNRGYVAIIVLALIGFGTLPFYVDVDSFFAYYLFICFVYIILAQGWNIVAGYTGQISLGSHAFFGLGAYATAILWLRDVTHTWYFFDPLVMFLSGLVSAVFAVIIGIPTLSRLRGDYFSFATLAAAQVLVILILRGGKFTQGAMGLRLPGTYFTDMGIYYWTALFLAILATAAIYFIIRSRIGLALRAISEDEVSAASHGIHILWYKLLAFATGAFIMGVCGSLFAYYLFFVSPSAVLNLNWLFLPILICILGGNGTVLGPIIGAFVVGALFSYGDVLIGRVHPMLSGILIILVMKFLPTGLIGLKDRISPRRRERRAIS
ncbi:MAG TPA: branched-chain amino acid ABC transporter permease [Dehalococcoidales bacterium]|nr:branched-chain amino acid ABC transporter permease [Dehalococcoidales bacterium]